MADEKKLWGGRFSEQMAGLVEAYTESVHFDKALYAHDIEGSKAHARMLADQGVLTPEDRDAIVAGLDEIRAEIEAGEFTWLTEREDVHMNIEARLAEKIGDAGRRLHTGRSRNDQVALDFRLFVAERLETWRAHLRDCITALSGRAEKYADTLLPGCTHTQPAQPVSLGHHLLAYCWMLRRDHCRMGDCLRRTRVSPLGAAALAGTTYPIDPEKSAAYLGLDKTFHNSMDAVTDRDFVAEALFCAALTMTHLSRICEELCWWANPQFGFVLLPDAYATGSSIMPQKKNPDVAEIMRGKTGRAYGALVAILTTLKGLPMTYNRDLQEDKEPFLDADKTVGMSLAIMAEMAAALEFNKDRMRDALSAGFLNATELADYLVGKGLPFRDAHHASGSAVAYAEGKGCGLEDLNLDEIRRFAPMAEQDVFEVLSYDAAVARRESAGGTGPQSVARQLADIKGWLKKQSK